MGTQHSCQPLLGVNISTEFVDLHFPYAGWGLLFFCWQHFEFQLVHVAVEGRNSVARNTHARLQISLLMRFLSLSHSASQCAFGDGVCQLLVRQFFSHFAQFKTTTKSPVNYVFLYPFCYMVISPKNNGQREKEGSHPAPRIYVCLSSAAKSCLGI